MKRIFLLATPVLLAVFVSGAAAQPPVRVPAQPGQPVAPTAGPCPKLELQTGANRILRDGEPVAFIATLAGGDANVSPTFIWSTSAGTIKGGQGTRSVEVDSTGAGADRQIVVELWVGGYAAECTVQVSTTVKVAGPATKVDEFGDLPLERETERLNGFAAALAESNDNVSVIAYAGRTNVPGHASNVLKRIKAQLAASGVPVQRISAVDGGFREAAMYELWVVPVGALAPKPTPTVDRKDIVYPKPTPTPVKKP